MFLSNSEDGLGSTQICLDRKSSRSRKFHMRLICGNFFNFVSRAKGCRLVNLSVFCKSYFLSLFGDICW